MLTMLIVLIVLIVLAMLSGTNERLSSCRRTLSG
jgi:hypothetical protein